MSGSASGRRLVSILKEFAGPRGPQLGLKAEHPRAGWLRPVGVLPTQQNADDVRCLSGWRNLYPNSFLTQFQATERQTSAWLAEVVAPDEGRILFMLDDHTGAPVAYLGIGFIDWASGYGEADSIVRGEPAERGLMSAALKTLLSWGQFQLGLTSIGVRVRSDNPALNFYRRFGFEETKRIPLSLRVEPDKLSYFEDSHNLTAGISLVHHVLRG